MQQRATRELRPCATEQSGGRIEAPACWSPAGPRKVPHGGPAGPGRWHSPSSRKAPPQGRARSAAAPASGRCREAPAVKPASQWIEWRTVLPDVRGSASDTPRCSSGVQAHFHGEPEALQPRSRRRRCSERSDILAHKVSGQGLRAAQRFTGNAQRMQALPSPMALVQVSIGPARAGQGLISTRRYGAQWRQQARRHHPVDPAP